MKLEGRAVEALLRDPGGWRAVLLYGDDAGLVRDRGSRLTRTVAGTVDDPFRVVELERDAASRLAEEMASPPLTGGRRVVRVREASDSVVASVQAALAVNGDGLLVLEATALPPRSKLRTLIERADRAAAVPCYAPEAAVVGTEIRAVLRTRGVSADDDALAWLEGHLGGDLAVVRGEAEKVALHAGAGGRIDLAAARACIGDLAGLSLEDALFAATSGDVAEADRSLEIALGEGATAVAVLRGALLHVQRLQRARLAMGGGAMLADAARSARPPVFFRREPAFRRALGLWTEAALANAATRLSAAERACKRTGAPEATICRNAILGLAQRGAAARTRELG